jgi:hypothetical protein
MTYKEIEKRERQLGIMRDLLQATDALKGIPLMYNRVYERLGVNGQFTEDEEQLYVSLSVNMKDDVIDPQTGRYTIKPYPLHSVNSYLAGRVLWQEMLKFMPEAIENSINTINEKIKEIGEKNGFTVSVSE